MLDGAGLLNNDAGTGRRDAAPPVDLGSPPDLAPPVDLGIDLPGGVDLASGVDLSAGVDSGGCPDGWHTCGGGCVSNVSAATCGTSCDPCPQVANGTPTCDGTSCGVACTDGFHACNGACASDTGVDTCGAACTPCPVPANGAAICDGTMCGITCNQNFIPQGASCVQSCDAQCDMRATMVTPATGGRFTGTTSGVSASAGSCGGGAAPEAVYKLMLTATSDVFVTTHGTKFDTVLYMRKGCCGAEIACNDNADGRNTSVLAAHAVAPGMYYVFVDGATDTAAGAFTVDIFISATSNNPGESCGNPVRISTAAVSGNSCGYRDDHAPQPSCAGNSSGPDVVYYFIVDTNTTVKFDTCTNTCFDTVLYIRNVCYTPTTQQSCDDNSCNSSGCFGGGAVQSRTSVALTPGVHYLFLDAAAGATPNCGPYTITPSGVSP
jgi:hypothetical protein